ncbi:zonadhesin [Amyelois transitella]|uniref:zonadhesin n=1 Tax=Amyelois transitella TaxID=680683 RepID=UPI00299079B4|nr:zonadhesin [Amyelois transitella]
MECRALFVCLFVFVCAEGIFGQVGSLCRANERLLSCGGCQATCLDPVPDCKGICREGCYCQEGQVRNSTGHCVQLAECPPTPAGLKQETSEPREDNCPENEEYRFCEPCNRTCDNPNPVCPAQCARGCFCKGDLVRDKDGRCVNYEKCSSRNLIKKAAFLPPIPMLSCGPRQVFKLCEVCEKTCSNPKPNCPSECMRGCFCQDGYYKAPSGACVKLEDCPEAEETIGGGDTTIDDCAPDEEYFSCGWCEPSCSDPNPDCPLRICTSGCLCKPPLLRHRSGHCVNAKDCIPQKCSNPNEEYVCRYGCEARCNANLCLGRPRRCSLGCHCKLGLLRDARGQCVAPEKCASNNTAGVVNYR